MNVRIARLFLEDEDNVEAERYLNRASDLIHLVNDPKLMLAYRGAFVRVLDYKRQFLKAALKYHQMSQDPLLNDDGQMQALDSAHKWCVFFFVGLVSFCLIFFPFNIRLSLFLCFFCCAVPFCQRQVRNASVCSLLFTKTNDRPKRRAIWC